MPRLVVVSNRVSVPSGDGTKRAGGLEVALRPTLHRNGGVWLGWSGKVAAPGQRETRSVKHNNVEYVVTDLTNEDYQEYYNGFANRVLWPILHYRLDLAEFARRDLSGYFRVNDHFATELDKIIGDDDLIWIHDYHLIPIAAALRRRGHANRIGYFLHVPFPPPEIVASLPNHNQLIPLLLDHDVVGFQTEGDVGNFVRYLISECSSMREVRVFESAGRHVTMNVNGHQIRIGSFPVGIEPRAFERLARRNLRSPLVKELVASLGNRVLVIGVDRLDYSKGLIQRLEAFDLFLAKHKEWVGRVTYLQIAPKNRSEIPQYTELEQAAASAAGRINGKYGEVSWTPIRYINRVYSRSTLAGLYRTARVGLITPVARRHKSCRQGICRCSGPGRSRGPYPVAIHWGCNPVPPRPLGQSLRCGVSRGAIAQALAMPLEERRDRHRALLAMVSSYDVDRWQGEFLSALRGDDGRAEKSQTMPAIGATVLQLPAQSVTAQETESQTRAAYAS